MDKLEKQELAKVVKAFSEEEQRFVLRNIPESYMLDELERRKGIMSQSISDVQEALKAAIGSKSIEEMSLEEMHDLISSMKSILN